MSESSPSKRSRVTIRDIAKEAGVSAASVSHAFRGNHHVSAETRRHILEVAEKMGYSPHPMVSALMAEIRRNKSVQEETVLAMVDFFTGAARLRKTSRNLIYEGAAKRAKALGYRLDLFEPIEEGWSLDRFAKILRARGINGIIVPPLPGQPDLPEGFPWEDFSVVTAGFVCRSHPFNSVRPDQLGGMELALSEVSKRGYHRVGLYISAELDRRVRHAWSGLYYWHCSNLEHSPPGELLHFYDQPSHEEFAEWLESTRPEVVISDFGVAWDLIQEYSKGRKTDYVLLICNQDNPPFCGINQNYAIEGASAVELLSTQLYRNERGAPALRMNVQISPTWVEGDSLSRKR
ncbi:MAG: LacI family DNA-binding transcriptional regulator [Verrucomicrobia bacterium]|nr:LacI family DNA-binding transcriptional regulator [Verrucomicrobiota bacterium]MCH8525620.1 LacI family transcriptional regulator [Kiritimatiellia bacterium]